MYAYRFATVVHPQLEPYVVCIERQIVRLRRVLHSLVRDFADHLLLPCVALFEHVFEVLQVSCFDITERVCPELCVADSTARACVRATVESLTVCQRDNVSRDSPIPYADSSEFAVLREQSCRCCDHETFQGDTCEIDIGTTAGALRAPSIISSVNAHTIASSLSGDSETSGIHPHS